MRKESLRNAANRYLKMDHRGHFKDKKHRAFVIHKMIDDLFILGDVPYSWHGLKIHHVRKLVQHWQKQKLKPATIMRYMTVVRSFLNKMNCPLTSIDNQSLNLTRFYQPQKKINIDSESWQSISEPSARFIMALQTQFGLTFGETIRLTPDIHIKEDLLWVTREIAFNSEDRMIPLRNNIQQTILDAFIEHTKGHQCLLQLHTDETIRYQWHIALAALKLPANKSYRFLYAQQLQKELLPTIGNYRTNWLIRDEMGIKSRNTLWLYLNE